MDPSAAANNAVSQMGSLARLAGEAPARQLTRGEAPLWSPPEKAPMSTIAVRTVGDLRQSLAPWRKAGERIALVPTMGALHDGHLSLIALAKSNADRVVASIFVNPIQFGPREDFHRYPRDEAGDLAKLEQAGANLVFAPETAEMYPHDFSTNVGVSDLTETF